MKTTLIAAIVTLGFLAPAAAETDFGRFSQDRELPVFNVADAIEQFDHIRDETILLTGNITSVCTAKGCWAMFEHDGQLIRVKAREHGFALPEELRGEALAEGEFTRVELSEEHKRHMVEDDGADTGLLQADHEYRLIADALRMVE